MRRVYVSSYPLDAEVVSTYLEANGIVVVVMREHSPAIGTFTMNVDGVPTVWVEHDDDEPRALELIARRKTERPYAPAWLCERCHEENDGDFGICWKCGGPAPPLAG